MGKKYENIYPGQIKYKPNWRPHEKALRANPDGNTSMKREIRNNKAGKYWRHTALKRLCLSKLKALDITIELDKLTTKKLVGLNGYLAELCA